MPLLVKALNCKRPILSDDCPGVLHKVQVTVQVIILGDFNAVEEISERRSSNLVRNSFVEALHTMVNGLQLIDVWKEIRKIKPH